jgi:hypothetical protein
MGIIRAFKVKVKTTKKDGCPSFHAHAKLKSPLSVPRMPERCQVMTRKETGLINDPASSEQACFARGTIVGVQGYSWATISVRSCPHAGIICANGGVGSRDADDVQGGIHVVGPRPLQCVVLYPLQRHREPPHLARRQLGAVADVPVR